MKKFLSICLVALCSVSAMYAQTASTDSRSSVSCGTEVKVEATSEDAFYHFDRWEIKNGSTILETLSPNGTADDGTNDYGATVSTAPLPDGSGKDKSTLTLNPLSSALIDAATSGTVTFEAFYEIDSYTITGTVEGTTGTVSGGGTTTGNNSVTLTAPSPSDPCTRFDHWESVNGDPIDDPTNPTLTVTPLATWEHNSTHSYKAVFVTKKVNIVVTTSDNSKGKVSIVTPAASPAPAGE